jgi:hypothetical protein
MKEEGKRKASDELDENLLKLIEGEIKNLRYLVNFSEEEVLGILSSARNSKEDFNPNVLNQSKFKCNFLVQDINNNKSGAQVE